MDADELTISTDNTDSTIDHTIDGANDNGARHCCNNHLRVAPLCRCDRKQSKDCFKGSSRQAKAFIKAPLEDRQWPTDAVRSGQNQRGKHDHWINGRRQEGSLRFHVHMIEQRSRAHRVCGGAVHIAKDTSRMVNGRLK